jgi:hypothetical protein
MCEVHVPIKFTYLIVCLKQRNNAVQWWSSNHGHVSKHWNKGLSVISHFSHQYATKGISVIAQCYTQSRAKEREESQSYHSQCIPRSHHNTTIPLHVFITDFSLTFVFSGKFKHQRKLLFRKHRLVLFLYCYTVSFSFFIFRFLQSSLQCWLLLAFDQSHFISQ